MGKLPNSLKGWSQPHDERNWLDGTIGTCPGETIVGKTVRITQGKHAGKRGTVVRHLTLWMGSRRRGVCALYRSPITCVRLWYSPAPLVSRAVATDQAAFWAKNG